MTQPSPVPLLPVGRVEYRVQMQHGDLVPLSEGSRQRGFAGAAVADDGDFHVRILRKKQKHRPRHRGDVHRGTTLIHLRGRRSLGSRYRGIGPYRSSLSARQWLADLSLPEAFTVPPRWRGSRCAELRHSVFSVGIEYDSTFFRLVKSESPGKILALFFATPLP